MVGEGHVGKDESPCKPVAVFPGAGLRLGLHMELQPGCGVASPLGKRRHRHPGRMDAGLSDTGHPVRCWHWS